MAMSERVPSPESRIGRRELLAGMGAITVSSACGPISPRRARASRAPLRRLAAAEGRGLEALGDVLLPGAAAAGLAHYVDDQLGRDDPLLILKYMDYTGPYLGFYREGLAALDRLSLARHSRPFEDIAPEQRAGLVGEISRQTPPGWSGPPAPLFYFVTRNDAIDVVYGTVEGFAALGVPYMPHILPPHPW